MATAVPLPPDTPVKPVQEDYFGTTVSDPYRWLEDMQSSEWKRWLKQQADYAEGVLAQIPGRAKLQTRLQQLTDASATVAGVEQAAGRSFYLKSEPGRNGRRLYMRNAQGVESLLLDPDSLVSSGAHYAIDWYSPAPDGRLIAVGVSQGGSEDSELRLLDLQTGQWLEERIDRAGLNNQLGWLPDGKTFFYNRLPQADTQGQRERYNKSAVYLHHVGEPVERDVAVLGWQIAPQHHFEIADIPYVSVAKGASYALATVLHGDATAKSYYIAPLDKISGPDTTWRRIISPADQVTDVVQHGEKLYLLSTLNAPRGKVLELDPNRTAVAKAKVLLPQAGGVIRHVQPAADGLYVKRSDGGIDQLLKVAYVGKAKVLKLPVKGTLRELSADTESRGALFKLEDLTTAPQYYSFDGKVLTGKTLMSPSTVSFTDAVSERVMVKSHDGVQVPMTILMPRGMKRNGSNPAIVWGYGAYGMTMEARFNPQNKAWLEQGGLMATCHVRGGGEYGETWHRAGYIQTKANTALDLVACADYLVKQGYTSPAKLAGQGRSAGGITIGGAITARPDLFTAANSAVGISDMLRMELTPNGPPNVAEFGTVTRKTDFRVMLNNSPYHRIKDGVAYPAVIVTTGANDPRVDAWMPAKLTARLQAASSSDKPVILRVDYDGGHGMGSTKAQQVAETADVWGFFLWRMGVPGFQPVN
ncbi:prolyl oligopeptidase family serine peptidase [Chitinimonas sp. BJB300]|uniref:prolyl oligopeptidase family serine peptidase n=1 Tax=Chitinimonas sp. BJB300 TaxID=1559339 RepID=UPI001642AA69|nr:prolyl oligopeptidase family serine peptidase [Chitinimonas sp. BJB300]